MGLRELFGFTKQEEIKGPRKLAVNRLKCPQNHHCPAVHSCPVGALSQVGVGAPKVNYNLCTGCGKCARYCFPRALVMEKK